MSKSIYPFILDRLIELEPKRGSASTRVYKGRDLVQMIKFMTFRDPSNPSDRTEVCGIASDSHYIFKVYFCPEATTRIEKQSGERTTSHLRGILALTSYTLELVRPLSYSTTARPTIHIHAQSWTYIHGSPDESVYHPSARELDISYFPSEQEGTGRTIMIPSIAFGPMKPDEKSRWLEKRKKACVVFERWMGKIRDDPVREGWEEVDRIKEEERKKAKRALEISSSDEGFAKRPAKVKVEQPDLAPASGPISTLPKLLAPSSEPLQIVNTILENYMSDHPTSIDYAFHIPPTSTSETTKSILTREAQMRKDLRGLQSLKTMQPGKEGKMEERYWDWEQAEKGRKEGWLEKWVDYEECPSQAQGGCTGAASPEASGSDHGASTMGDETSFPNKAQEDHSSPVEVLKKVFDPHATSSPLTSPPLLDPGLISPVKESQEIPIPWSQSPIMRRIRPKPKVNTRDENQGSSGSSPAGQTGKDDGAQMGAMIEQDDDLSNEPPSGSSSGPSGSALANSEQPQPTEDMIQPASSAASAKTEIETETETETEDESIDIRRPSGRRSDRPPTMTQTRPIEFRGMVPSSPGSARSDRDEDEDDVMGIGGSMMFTQAYRAHGAEFGLDASDDEEDSAEARRDEEEEGKEEDEKSNLGSHPIETANSDEVLGESLEENGPVIFSGIGYSTTEAGPSSKMSIGTRHQDLDAEREVMDQLAPPSSQGMSSVLVEESDEEDQKRRELAGKGSITRGSTKAGGGRSKTATPRKAIPGSTAIPSTAVTPTSIPPPPKATEESPRPLNRKRKAEDESKTAMDPEALPIIDLKGKKRMRKSLEGTSKFTPIPLPSQSVSGGAPPRAQSDARKEPGRDGSGGAGRSRTGSILGSEKGTKKARKSSLWTDKLELDLGEHAGMTLEDLLK